MYIDQNTEFYHKFKISKNTFYKLVYACKNFQKAFLNYCGLHIIELYINFNVLFKYDIKIISAQRVNPTFCTLCCTALEFSEKYLKVCILSIHSVC